MSIIDQSSVSCRATPNCKLLIRTLNAHFQHQPPNVRSFSAFSSNYSPRSRRKETWWYCSSWHNNSAHAELELPALFPAFAEIPIGILSQSSSYFHPDRKQQQLLSSARSLCRGGRREHTRTRLRGRGCSTVEQILQQCVLSPPNPPYYHLLYMPSLAS